MACDIRSGQDSGQWQGYWLRSKGPLPAGQASVDQAEPAGTDRGESRTRQPRARALDAFLANNAGPRQCFADDGWALLSFSWTRVCRDHPCLWAAVLRRLSRRSPSRACCAATSSRVRCSHSCRGAGCRRHRAAGQRGRWALRGARWRSRRQQH